MTNTLRLPPAFRSALRCGFDGLARRRLDMRRRDPKRFEKLRRRRRSAKARHSDEAIRFSQPLMPRLRDAGFYRNARLVAENVVLVILGLCAEEFE
jgi:hypothetical protein